MSRPKKVHRKMARNYNRRQSMRYKLADGLFLYFPPLTKEQQAERQRSNASHNKHDYPSSFTKFTKEQRSAWAKKQWRENKAYRKMMEENSSKWAKMATIRITENHISKRYQGQNPKLKQFDDRRREVNRLIDEYGLGMMKIGGENPLNKDELEKLYYTLKTLE